VIARTLSRRIAMRTADADAFRALQYLQCDPEIERDPPLDMTILVERYRSYYRIVEDEQPVAEQGTPRAVTELLHARLFDLLMEDYPTAPLIHAASLRRGGRRLLLVGAKGAGKSTLTLHLATIGYEVEGDENVFVTAKGVVARPRGMRLKDTAIHLFPHIAPILLAAPSIIGPHDQRIYNLDPRLIGSSWRIEHGPVDVVIMLRPNHGGYSSIRPLPPLALVREVMAESGLHETQRGSAIAALVNAIGSARGFDLSLGDHPGAVRCIDQVFASFPDLLRE
jgi:energy-coupling factor transporter ATP-binding protein EcfA2